MSQTDNQQSGTAGQNAAVADNSTACQLLVSVRDANEALMARRAGVSWIDLKDPARGPLGAPSMETAQEVAQVLQDHSQSSAALGELHQLDFDLAMKLASHFRVLKVGLSNPLRSRDFTENWAGRLRSLQSSLQRLDAILVPVIYADWKLCNAVRPADTIETALSLSAKYLLVDTFFKDGSSLLDHTSSAHLEDWCRRLQVRGCKLVLAGSLRLQHVPTLRQLRIAALGVRGAVCSEGREGRLSWTKLCQWQALF